MTLIVSIVVAGSETKNLFMISHVPQTLTKNRKYFDFFVDNLNEFFMYCYVYVFAYFKGHTVASGDTKGVLQNQFQRQRQISLCMATKYKKYNIKCESI